MGACFGSVAMRFLSPPWAAVGGTNRHELAFYGLISRLIESPDWTIDTCQLPVRTLRLHRHVRAAVRREPLGQVEQPARLPELGNVPQLEAPDRALPPLVAFLRENCSAPSSAAGSHRRRSTRSAARRSDRLSRPAGRGCSSPAASPPLA